MDRLAHLALLVVILKSVDSVAQLADLRNLLAPAMHQRLDLFDELVVPGFVVLIFDFLGKLQLIDFHI